jgi:crotonobetaine/carnitine-CoA ligase
LAAPEIAFQIADTTPAVVLAQPAHHATLTEAIRESGHQPCALSLGVGGEWPEHLETAPGAGSVPTADIDPMDPYQIFYTSGSTDRPKGVIHSQRSAVEEAHRIADAFCLRPDDVLFSHMPIYHVSGFYVLLYPALLRAASAAFGSAFSARRWVSDARSVGATVTPIVATQIRMIMANKSDEPELDRDNRIRLAPCGMAVPQAMEDEFVERFDTGPLYAISGSTECIGLTYIEPAYSEHRWPALGRPAADREIVLVDDYGDPVPVGQEGEICVKAERGAALMLGYWNRPDATAAASVDGWFRTGDIGRMDEGGWVYFVDRKKDIIKRAGENVSASEVERVLCQFPRVGDAAVVGKPDPIRDWAIVAFLEPSTPGARIDVEELLAHCRRNLAAYKIPEDVRVVPELPRGSVGKLEKKALRAIVEAETGSIA